MNFGITVEFVDVADLFLRVGADDRAIVELGGGPSCARSIGGGFVLFRRVLLFGRHLGCEAAVLSGNLRQQLTGY